MRKERRMNNIKFEETIKEFFNIVNYTETSYDAVVQYDNGKMISVSIQPMKHCKDSYITQRTLMYNLNYADSPSFNYIYSSTIETIASSLIDVCPEVIISNIVVMDNNDSSNDKCRYYIATLPQKFNQQLVIKLKLEN